MSASELLQRNYMKYVAHATVILLNAYNLCRLFYSSFNKIHLAHLNHPSTSVLTVNSNKPIGIINVVESKCIQVI